MLNPEDLDHADFPGAPAVRPCARLDVPGHFYHADIFSLRHPALGTARTRRAARPWYGFRSRSLLPGWPSPSGLPRSLSCAARRE